MKNVSTIYLVLFLLSSPVLAGASGDRPPHLALTDYNRDYYLKVFDYTMDNVAAGKSYHWDAKVMSGDIAVSEKYISNSKVVCRDFSEIFTAGGKSGKSEGIACKRKDDSGWCRLNRGDAMTCAFESQSTTDKLLDGAKDAIGRAFGR